MSWHHHPVFCIYFKCNNLPHLIASSDNFLSVEIRPKSSTFQGSFLGERCFLFLLLYQFLKVTQIKFRKNVWFFCEIKFNWKLTSEVVELCTMPRNIENVKLRLDFVEIWWFYRHSNFVWNQVLANSNGWKCHFLAILETQNFEFW